MAQQLGQCNKTTDICIKEVITIIIIILKNVDLSKYTLFALISLSV